MAKRVKTDKKHEFKHEGNRQQFNHQSDVKEALQSAFDALVNFKYEQAKEAVEEGMLLIEKRSKLIILADKYCWILLKNINAMRQHRTRTMNSILKNVSNQ